MKKILTLTAILAIALLPITACNSSNAPLLAPTPVPTMPDIPQPPEPVANQPAVIHYEHIEGGKFLFVNGPEPIDRQDIAEVGINLYEGEFDGSLHLCFYHNNYMGTGIYYGIHFHNPNDQAATLTLKNHGASFGWTTNSETIRLWYYTAGVSTDYTIAAGDSMWLFFTDNEDLPRREYGARTFTTEWDPIANHISHMNGTFDGKMRVYGSRPLEVRVMSWVTENLNDFDPFETVYPNSKHWLGTTGYSPYLGEVAATMAWTVDDTTAPGRMPVSISGHVDNRWTTHAVSRNRYVVNQDSLPLTVLYNDQEHVLTPDRPDIRSGQSWPWANIGVIYHHYMFFTNNSSVPRVFAAYIERGAGRNAYMGAYSPLNDPAFQLLPFSDINNWLDHDQLIAEITVMPGETGFLPYEFSMGGQSHNLVGHYVVMRDAVTFENVERMDFSIVEDDELPETQSVTFRNTSGIEHDRKELRISYRLAGDTPEAFTWGVTDGDILDEQWVLGVRPAYGLAAGVYEATFEAFNIDTDEILGIFPIRIVVHAQGVYDYLPLVPIDAWTIHTGNSIVNVEYGPLNADGVPSLIFSNTAGQWPAATGALKWGSGIHFPLSEWGNIVLEFDVEVSHNASIVLLTQGPSLPQNRIPITQVMAQFNTLDEGGLDGDDLRRGRYVGRVWLDDLMNIRDQLPTEYYFLMPPIDDVYMDGWRVFAIGPSPATVTVNRLRFIRE